MNKQVSKKSLFAMTIVTVLAVLAVVPVSAKGFERGVVVLVEDGEEYYFAGEPVGDGWDIPGHSWVKAGPNQWVGKHINTGPGGAPQWWSSNAPNGELLYIVHGIIDTWTLEKGEEYAARGYVHRHELVTADGELHPTKVIWFRHTARTSFTLDGGPGQPNPPYEHEVTPGVDYEFPNNYLVDPWAP
jgi:selenium-binding protein 1